MPINIQADENTNALVITAPPDILRALESVIKQLDDAGRRFMSKA